MAKKLLCFALPYSIVSIFLLFALSSAFADVTGSLNGVVHDRAQAVVVGAKITITNTETGQSQSAVSAADGSYHFL